MGVRVRASVCVCVVGVRWIAARARAAGSGDSGDEAVEVGRRGAAPAGVILPLVMAGACRHRLCWLPRVIVRLARPAVVVVSRGLGSRPLAEAMQAEGRGLQAELLGLLGIDSRHRVVVPLPR